MAKKKLRSRVTEEDRRTKQNAAGANRGKTRPDVPSTRANKASTGKQTIGQYLRRKANQPRV